MEEQQKNRKILSGFVRYGAMKRLVFLFLAASCGSSPTPTLPSVERETAEYFIQLKAKAKEAKEFCKKRSYNTDLCILADMSIHSGKNRIFVWDHVKDTILMSGLCSHGCGEYPWAGDYTKTNPVISNVSGSHCTSLGKFKIGKRGWSSFGINVNYLLHGLDSSNSNALERQIVFHSWELIPDEELYPAGTPEGWGCPAVSDNFMRKIDEKLKTAEKPTLLWMFN